MVDRVSGVVAARGVPNAQVSLAWVLAQPGITAPIIGASKMPHFDDAMAALSLELDANELQKLSAASDSRAFVSGVCAAHAAAPGMRRRASMRVRRWLFRGRRIQPAPLAECGDTPHEALFQRMRVLPEVAFVGAEFFAGEGTQRDLLLMRCDIVWGPADDSDVIKEILRKLGATSQPPLDEFDTVGLGRHRRTAHLP